MDLRHYLFENNLKATEFAAKIGVHRNTIYGIMTGKVPCSIGTALLIEKFTNGKVSRYEVPMTDRSRETLLRSIAEGDDSEKTQDKNKQPPLGGAR